MTFWAKEILVALLILTFFWMLAQIAELFLHKWGKRLASFTKTDLDDRILQRVIPHVSRLLITLGIYQAIRSLPLHEKLVVIVSGLLYIVLAVLVCNLIYHALDELLSWYVSSQQETAAGSLMSRQMVPVVEKVVSLFLIGAAMIVILKHFNYDIFSLVTALGIGSLAIGMAAKDTLAHMISGFTLMIDRPFQIGDRIKLSNDKIGDVVDIGLRSTKIQGLDTTVMIIPNSDLCNSTVTNLVRPTTVIQGRITVGVGYGSDIDHVKEVMLELTRNNCEVVEEPAPLVLFISFGDSALNMLLLFWVQDPTRLGVVTDQLNCNILRRFREEDIEIPFPIRTVQLSSNQPVT
ncbi:MAG: mechanosensitive ion channel family protein [Deltaproteobacteria bacterium]|nr:mechanosensitive ion channel family protein [Deltaproteobacteria bacterium]